MLAEPRPPLQPDERRVELLGRRAPLDVAPPAAEPRLEHDRELGDGRGQRGTDERGVRVRQAGEPERARGQQLVVGDDEGCRWVPYVHAAGREPLELAGAAFDAVELLANVEARERDVSRLEERERPVWIDELRLETPRPGCRDERVVRRAVPVSYDGELHAEIVRTERAPMGLDPVWRW